MISVPTFSYEAYWTDFDISGEDLDFIYNLLLDREVPLTTEEMSSALVEYRLERLEKEAQEAVEIDYTIYLPVSKYEVGQRVLFPALGNTIGSIVGVRDGENPEISEFDVIKVKFEESGQQKEIAARLEDHILNNPPDPELDEDELSNVDGVMRMYSRLIDERLIRSLENEEDIVWIAGSWFPKALLADIHEGHLNLAEAVLDVASGGPLPTTNLLEPIEMPSGIDPLLMAFSLDYALQEDDRFDEVGPAGQVLWYLKRLEPPEVLFPPPRLEPAPTNVNRTVLTEDLIALERSLDDELSPLEPLDEVLD